MARVLSVLFAAAPFVFGATRAMRGSDPRMLWMALASGVGALAIRALGGAWASARPAPSTLATLAVTTLLAGITAMAFGARAAFGIWAVALVLGCCWAASHALHLASRRSRAV